MNSKKVLLLETFDYQGFLSEERELFETITETVDEIIEKLLEESEATTVANDQNNEKFLRPSTTIALAGTKISFDKVVKAIQKNATESYTNSKFCNKKQNLKCNDISKIALETGADFEMKKIKYFITNLIITLLKLSGKSFFSMFTCVKLLNHMLCGLWNDDWYKISFWKSNFT